MEEKTEELKKHLQIVTDDDDVDVYTDATPLASKIPRVDYKIHTKRNRPYFKIIRADGNHMLFISLSIMLKNFNREDLESLWIIVRYRFEKTKPKNYSDDYLLNTLKIIFEKPNVEASVWKYQKGSYGLAKTQVEDESQMSLELLRSVRRQLNEGAGDEDLMLLLEITTGEEDRRRQYYVVNTVRKIHSHKGIHAIVDYKIYKEERKSLFKIIRADGNSQNYLTFRKMFKNFNREDLEVLWSIVKARFLRRQGQ
nr:hypothetical protein [Tanacetum cinerariifolium]